MLRLTAGNVLNTSFRNRACRVLGLISGAAAVVTAARIWLAARDTFSLQARKQHVLQQSAFVLMVKLEFQDAQHRNAFVNFWAPLADYVRAHECGTLAFELLRPDSGSLELLVYERYIDKDYYLYVHRTSAAMATFKQHVADAPFEVKITGQSYNELNVGFML